MENVLDVLRERGFVQDLTAEPELRKRLEQPVTLYYGVDATAASLHIGQVVQLMMLSWFQRFGHRPIALMGGGTTLVGDPTGKTSSRPMLTEREIEQNIRGIKPQLERFFDFDDGRALMVNNRDWLKPLNFVDFMRDIGSRFSLNEVLRLEAYRTRLEAGGMTFLELSYVLMQSYDFLRLYQDYDCVLQVGGSDQWGNSIMGADLVRRVTGAQAFVLVTPLITTAEGAKLSKSEKTRNVWLDLNMTSPYDYYQHWRDVPDSAVKQSLDVFTFLPMEEINSLTVSEGSELNQAKELLAFEATKIVHGEDEANKAQQASRGLFAGAEVSEEVGELVTHPLDCAAFPDGIPVTDLFKEARLVSSSNEARSLISQGGLFIDDQKVTDPRARIDLTSLNGGQLMLSRGKKRRMRIVCQPSSATILTTND
jgi:tyrosyl-tRNA synthetase